MAEVKDDKYEPLLSEVVDRSTVDGRTHHASPTLTSSATSPSSPVAAAGRFVRFFHEQQLRHRRNATTTERLRSIDSVCYEAFDSTVWNDRKTKIAESEEGVKGCTVGSRCEVGEGKRYLRNQRILLRWALAGIGIATASIGFFLVWSSDQIATLCDGFVRDDGANMDSYGRYVGLQLIFALLAFIPIAFIRPVAAGSGIAEAKAILNGIAIPRCTELTSAACKWLSVLFAEVSSLPCGLEGPLTYIAMSIGENFNRFFPRKYPELRSWKSRRDLATVGTAAGISIAFLSPIGGVLFAVEEGASFITTHLMWQCFAAAITVVIMDYLWAICDAHFDYGYAVPDNESIAIGLAKFSGLPETQDQPLFSPPSFVFPEYFVFAGIGVIGGTIGACFVEGSKYLAKIRQRYIRTRLKKAIELLLVVTLASTLFYWLPTLPQISSCKSLTSVRASHGYFLQFNCEDGHYNDLATLLRRPLPVAVNLLFWEGDETFSGISCFVAGVTVLILTLLTFGCTVAMGIFIPLLYVGAALGRALGLMHDEFDVRTYALVCSVASLNGVIRVLISITVIMMETTSLSGFVSPFMVVALCSRFTGNNLFLSDGIYDEILKMRRLPFLEEESPEITKRAVLCARDIISPAPLILLEPTMCVGDLVRILRENDHLDFPVIDPSKDGVLVGSLSREHLKAVLWHHFAMRTDRDDGSDAESSSIINSVPAEDRNVATYYEFDQYDEIEIEDAELYNRLDGGDLNLNVEISRYAKIAPVSFEEAGSAERAYQLFRTLGLRQLVVVDLYGKPSGAITRFDLKTLEEEDELERTRRGDEDMAQGVGDVVLGSLLTIS